MSPTAVARLEGNRTHDGFERPYHRGKWLDQSPFCKEDGVQGNRLLMGDFCPNFYHFGCVGLDVHERAQFGDWKVDDLARLDEKPRGRCRPKGTVRPTTHNTIVTQLSTLPVATEQLRKRGRPRTVIRFRARLRTSCRPSLNCLTLTHRPLL